MTKLTDTLARLGTARISGYLNPATVELLQALDLATVTSSQFAHLVIQQRGVNGWLLDPVMRKTIFDALAEKDAAHLARLLCAQGDTPWAALEQMRFRDGDNATATLFRFFGHEPPAPPESGDHVDALELIRTDYPLFKHQREAFCRVLDQLRSPPRRVLLHMPTGAGKTRTAMNVIAQVLREEPKDHDVVIWLAHNEELCEQAAQEFSRAWAILGNRDIHLYRQFAQHQNPLDMVRAGLLVGSLDMMYSRSLREQSSFLDLARHVKLVIMDEAHQAIAPTYKHLLRLLAPNEQTAILGLSATPGRSWLDAEEDARLAAFFYRNKVGLEIEGHDDPISFLQAEGYLAKAEYVSLPYAPGSDITLSGSEKRAIADGFDVPDRIIERLSQDQQRNLLLLQNIRAEADRGGKIIVFACSVDHAHLLADMLQLQGYRAAAVTSTTPRLKRQQTITAYRDRNDLQILTNFGVLTMGFDAPRTNTAVIARPTQSVVLYGQMVGRAARGPKAGGNDTCRILTVVDQIPGFRDMADAFSYWDDIWD